MNRKIKHICFDLDGTLTDSLDTIYKTTLKTLEVFKISNSLSKTDLRKRVGFHFKKIFNELKVPVKDVDHFINVYKQFYFDYIEDTKPYPGVIETLRYLKKNNYLVSLLTTKAQDQAEKIMGHFNLSEYFNLIMGGIPGIPVKPSPEPLLLICKELNVDIGETLMTGDAEIDVTCGKNAGAFTCAVLYGYRKKEELLELNPDFVIDEISGLISYVGK